MRPLVLSATVAALGSSLALALTMPSPAGAASSGQSAKTITVTVKDGSGDVAAVQGPVTFDGTSVHEGASSKATPTAADKAIDLTKVTYAVMRTGQVPALRIKYVVTGPFSKSTSTRPPYSVSFDGVRTSLGHGYSVVSINNPDVVKAGVLATGLVDGKGRAHACKGFGQTQASRRVAYQYVPLSCLSAVGIRAARLSSGSMHGTVVQTSASGGRYTLATDGTGATRTLPLTPYSH